MVQTHHEGEGRGEEPDGEGAVAGEDRACESGDSDVEEARGEWFGGRDEGFDFALDRAFDGDPSVDERADGGARVGGEVRKGASGGTDLTLEFGLHGHDLEFGVG